VSDISAQVINGVICQLRIIKQAHEFKDEESGVSLCFSTFEIFEAEEIRGKLIGK
jgi:hypothetical protein